MEWQDTPEPSLSERDIDILKVIEEEDLTSFTFAGMRRRVGAHPETLSRSLYRLEEEGFLEKEFEGYKVTPKAKELMGVRPLCAGEAPVSLLQTLLPPTISTQRIISELKGKWFGVLRWLGYSENDEEVTLKWITDNSRIQVDAKFSGDELNIESKLLSDEDLNFALEASYQLIGHITKIYSRAGRIKQRAYSEIFDYTL